MDASYVVGMLAATSMLHLIGMAISLWAQRRLGASAARWVGASIALGGLALAVSA
jgi:hydrogenase/urease accessory protein HupE